MERFLTEENATFVVDNGASTFLPLWHYLLENSALDYLRRNGRRVYVHTVITGGQALLDTLNGFHELAQTTEERNIVVWVNEYFGRVEAEARSSRRCRPIARTRTRSAARSSSRSGIRIPWTRCRGDDRGKADVPRSDHRGEADDHGEQRLKIVQRDLFEQLDGCPSEMATPMTPDDLKRIAAEVSIQHGSGSMRMIR